MQHEDVGRLEVAVHHAVRVQVGHLLRGGGGGGLGVGFEFGFGLECR